MQDQQVRIASQDDLADLVYLCRKFHEEEGRAPLDEILVVDAILRALAGEGLIGIIGEPGAIQSSIYLLIARPWYSSEPVLEHLWWFTLPEYRKSSNSKALLTFAKNQADRLGCPLLLEVVANEGNRPKLSLCERVLGEPNGAGFLYQPNHAEPTVVGTPSVRVAAADDEDEVLDVCRELHRENGTFSSDEEMSIPVIRDCLAGNGVIGVVGDKGSIEGTIFLQIRRMWYSRAPLLEESFAYVRPDFRKSPNARALLMFARRQADLLDIPLRIGVISKIETQRKIALYRRLLGDPANAFFLYR